MRTDLDIFGVYVPSLLLGFVIAYVLSALLSRLFRRIGLYQHVWHRALFDLAVFACLLGMVVFLSSGILA
ncbi:DUF1656 domain-containing protein [Bosea sp. 2YAB26]|jgi:H+/Cl- antiporter ClcA|uniref:DUF1656 domain-containing protein n=1 Tax=unclassified Bosea (in: a-proteobacteria) TaxID=2653178 RepID=UPI003F92ACFD